MPKDNLQRLIKLAEDIFAVNNDPNQLNVNQKVIQRLQKMHPASLSEYRDKNGPAAWVLIIPTTMKLMEAFLSGKINERELFYSTPTNIRYECLYLCSALVLEEYRRKGIAGTLALSAIETIRRDHPIRALFVWPFSREGDLAAEAISRKSGLPLYKKMKE